MDEQNNASVGVVGGVENVDCVVAGCAMGFEHLMKGSINRVLCE